MTIKIIILVLFILMTTLTACLWYFAYYDYKHGYVCPVADVCSKFYVMAGKVLIPVFYCTCHVIKVCRE